MSTPPPLRADAVRLILVAGASGSGKSRLARHTACLQFRLDDFYLDEARVRDELAGRGPVTAYGIIDWDDPAVWDAEAALAALQTLLTTGEVEVPEYSIPQSRAVGSHTLRLDGRACVLAEGIFAIEMKQHLAAAGLPVTAIYLDRPGWLIFLLRLRRDLALKRKPPHILLRRGWALWRAQPDLKRRALAAGFIPLSMRKACAAVT